MKFYGQFDTPIARFIFERYFADAKVQGIFVECGASDGLQDSVCKFFEETKGWKGFNLEPVQWIFDSLCKNRPLSQNLNMGLSDKNLNLESKQLISSPMGGVISSISSEEINISVITWRDFVLLQKITRVDLFVIDVERYELVIIEGMQYCNVLPDVMCVKYGNIGLDIIRDRLIGLGYVYDTTSNGSHIFVQKDMLRLFALRCCVARLTKQNVPKVTQSILLKNGPLAFIHIPKCSGTSFETYLATSSQFKGSCRCFTGVDQKRRSEDLGSYLRHNASSSFVFGHISYADYEIYIPNALFATFLRDPVQRTISQYKSWHDPKNFHPEDPHYIGSPPLLKEALEFAQRATLEEFVKTDNSIVISGALGNIQTKMLSSYSNVSFEMHLESAKENLAKCIFFGLTEKFEESIGLFQSIFPDAPAYELEPVHENRSLVEVSDISSETMDIIKEQVSFDILLYDFAKTLFEERKYLQFVVRQTFLLNDLVPVSNENLDAKLDAITQLLTKTLSDKEMLNEENQLVSEQLEALAVTYKDLTGVYENIIGSKGWLAIEAMRSITSRFNKK